MTELLCLRELCADRSISIFMRAWHSSPFQAVHQMMKLVAGCGEQQPFISPQISPSCRTLPNGSFNYLNGQVKIVCSLEMQSGIQKQAGSDGGPLLSVCSTCQLAHWLSYELCQRLTSAAESIIAPTFSDKRLIGFKINVLPNDSILMGLCFFLKGSLVLFVKTCQSLNWRRLLHLI